RSHPGTRFSQPALVKPQTLSRCVQHSVRQKIGNPQLLFRKITAPGTQITAGVAQNIYQLQAASIFPAQFQHIGFHSRGETLNFPKTNARPNFPHTSRDEISVFAQLLRIAQGSELSMPARKLTALAARDDCEQLTDITLILR